MVQGLVSLRPASVSSGLAETVDLVDEDDAGRVPLRRREQVSHSSRSDTTSDELFLELRPEDCDERDPGFLGHRQRKEALSRPGGTLK